MTYCAKCGKKNDDDAEFCKKCGKPLSEKATTQKKDVEDRCEEECPAGGKRGAPIFWAILLVLIGLVIIFEGILKNITLPDSFSWIHEINFGLIFAAVIGILFIIWGLRLVSRRD